MKKNNYTILLFFLLCYQFVIAQTPPNAQDDNYTIETNITLEVAASNGILANDTDADGDTLIVTEFSINGTTYMAGDTANFLVGNSITLNPDGSFTFVTSLNSNDSVPIINYTISDGTFTSSANLIITIINSFPPEAINDCDTVEINTPLIVEAPGVLTNDTDADGNTLTVTEFSVNGVSAMAGEEILFSEGSITINSDGSFTFIPTANYTGDVPIINYIISDGTFTSSTNLSLTVQPITDLLEISSLSSCNQGYTVDGEYKIRYGMNLRNKSTARDYHATNLIRNINLTNDLQAIYGNGCVIEVDQITITTANSVLSCVDSPYPLEFDNSAINPNFLNATSSSIFNQNAIDNFTLYPGQSINVRFCVTVRPFCNGRPNPTASGSGINFNHIINATSTIGSDTANLLLTDFHTTEAVVTAGLYIPESSPPVNPDGTYDYTNRVIITNEGSSTANNINYNMGLRSFLDNNITFNELTVTQVSGPSVNINGDYNGDTNTQLLTPNNSLASGETIILEIFSIIAPISSLNSNSFNQLTRSQTQGALDGFDETTAANNRAYSFVIWSDGLGNHLDRYYPVSSPTETASSTLQCSCNTSSMVFSFLSSSTNTKTISAVNETPNGILEHQEITFQLTITNTSEDVQLDNLQLQDDLNNICLGNVVSVSAPVIQNSTATTPPILNPSYNGTTDTNLFNGTSGLLMADESITVEFTVLFSEDCINTNTSNFSATNPLGNTVNSSGTVNVNASTDTDNDGITNPNDIDDDNDTIPDTDEYNGLNPLDDDDADFIPNYRDTDFGADTNGDGIIDIFDFDHDGVPNHFDLDSDNDGILDIVEVGNATQDTNNNGTTNNSVGANGLDNTIENDDTFNASITYTIPNTDANGNANFLDIDADGDGIVDNIEAQLTANYISPNGTVGVSGIDTAYPNGITPIDTDSDTVFDYLDTNSDNDIRDDVIEGWDLNNDGIAETMASNIDADNDGLDDGYDTNDNLVNPTNGQIPTDFPNVDNADTPERDWREIIAIVVLINNVSATEGGDLIFTISLVTKNDNSILIQSASPITINLSTANGTDTTAIYDVATAPYDYNEVTTTMLTIPPFNETAQFTVTSLEDIIYELEEFFTLNGVITSNNTITTETKGIGTILDNDDPPSITMNNSIEEEGTPLEHIITISHPSSTPIQINIDTNDGTAINPDDYTTVSESLTIAGTIDPDNANTQTDPFYIPTIIDNLNEADQEFLNVIGTVTTTNVGVQDLTKTGTIIDIDPYPILHIDNATVVEGNPLVFTITLLNAASEQMQNYLPIDLDLETIDQTASFIEDYQQLLTTVSIPAYTSSTTQSVTTIDDRLNENTETMLLRATIISTNPANISSATGTGFIKDNDFPNLFSPNSDGKSDVFKISGIEDFPNFILKIIDRWGSEVYNYSNNGNINPIWWDGTRNGKPVPEGVYFYTLDFNDGVTKPRTNFIELVR